METMQTLSSTLPEIMYQTKILLYDIQFSETKWLSGLTMRHPKIF